jgi:hypothetical protein
MFTRLSRFAGGNMEKKDLKITIDANGNIRREVVDQIQPEERKPRFLKKLVSTLPI